MPKIEDYKVVKKYANASEILDLKEIVKTVSTKVYINETSIAGGFKIEFVGVSKAFVDYVLYEMDKLEAKKKALPEIPDSLATRNLECETKEDGYSSSDNDKESLRHIRGKWPLNYQEGF